MDCSLPGSSVHGINQARILEWVAVPSFTASSWHQEWTHISCSSWTTGEAPYAVLSQSIAMIGMIISPWEKMKSKDIENALVLETFW